jgi:hypothetical protein
MHPNLYKKGKVCMSILNSWAGDSWTGCQSIASVLLSIRSILSDNALTNEPGISIKNPEVPLYNEIIRYKNISIAIVEVLTRPAYLRQFPELIDIAKQEFIDNFDAKKLNLTNSISAYNTSKYPNIISTNAYAIKCHVQYDKLIEDLDKLYIKLKNEIYIK